MEIKATLNKPYTDVQKSDFIVEQNHIKGYKIKETETALEAWGYTKEEQAEKDKEIHIFNLKKQLSELDSKSARSIRAILANTATEEDRTFLSNLESQAIELRRQIKELEESL